MLNRFQVGRFGLLALTLGSLGLAGLGWKKSNRDLRPLPQDPHVQVFF